MKSKWVIVCILLVFALSATTSAVLYSAVREPAEEGCLQIVYGGKKASIAIDKLCTEKIQGSIVNGKGETKAVEAKGIYLDRLLADYAAERLTAVSDDGYTASVLREEWKNACIIENDGGLKLIVFGDKDSKRAVKNLIRLELE